MAAAVLLLEKLTVPAIGVIPNVTALTGGLNEVNGVNGSDWKLVRNSELQNESKYLGLERIRQTPFATGGDPAPLFSISSFPRFVSWDINDSQNNFSGDGGGSLVLGGNTTVKDSGVYYNNSPTQLNCGIQYVFNIGQNKSRFVWMGGINGGTYTVTATVGNGEITCAPIQIVSDPVQIYAPTYFWWACTMRTVNPTTVTLKLTKTALEPNGISMNIWPQMSYMEPDVKPPHGKMYKFYQAYLGTYGG